MAKCKSKATGEIFYIMDGFDNQSYRVALFLNEDDYVAWKPRARLTYAEFVEAFDKVD